MSNWRSRRGWDNFSLGQAFGTSNPNENVAQSEAASSQSRALVVSNNQPVNITVVPTHVPHIVEVTAAQRQQDNLPMGVPEPPWYGTSMVQQVVRSAPADQPVVPQTHPLPVPPDPVPSAQAAKRQRLDTAAEVQRTHRNIATDSPEPSTCNDGIPQTAQPWSWIFHNSTGIGVGYEFCPSNKQRRPTTLDTSHIPQFVPYDAVAHISQRAIDESTPDDFYEEFGEFINSGVQLPPQQPAVQPLAQQPEVRTFDVPLLSQPRPVPHVSQSEAAVHRTEADELVAIVKSMVGTARNSYAARILKTCSTLEDIIATISKPKQFDANTVRPIAAHIDRLKDKSPGQAGLLLLAYLFAHYVPHHEILTGLPELLPKTWPTGCSNELRLGLLRIWSGPLRKNMDRKARDQIVSLLTDRYGI